MRFALLVDAGYLYADGSKVLSPAGSTPLPRRAVELDQDATIAKLLETAAAKTDGASLLRIYWYDGVLPSGMSASQRDLANTDNVKFRAGVVNSAGQQKGVDSLIVTDLIELSRNHAISDAVLFSGDGDLRIAVQIAQSFGVRVHLIGIEPASNDDRTRAQLLSQEADTTTEWSRSDLVALITLQPGFDAAMLAGGTAASEISDQIKAALDQVIAEIIGSIPPGEMNDLAKLRPSDPIPSQYDRALLANGSAKLGIERLERAEITYLRNRFREGTITGASHDSQ